MRYNVFMKFKPAFFTALLITPAISSAQSLQAYIPNVITFLGDTFISFLIGFAFLVFVINTVRFFIIESNNEEGRKKAKALMTYSVMAFTLIIVFWGIINILGTSFGFADDPQPISDFIER